MTRAFGFHLQRDGQLLHMSSLDRSYIRHKHRELKRQGWHGRRWAIQLREEGGVLWYG